MKLKQNYAPFFPWDLKALCTYKLLVYAKSMQGRAWAHAPALVVEPLPEQECSPAVEGRWHFSVSHRGTA